MEADRDAAGTAGAAARVGRVAGNAWLAAATASRSVAEDPLTFGIQLARRFPVAREALLGGARAARGHDGELLRAWLGGDLASTRDLLDALASRGTLSRVAAEVAQAAGRPELIVDDPGVHESARARAAWQLGEASLAIALVERAGRERRLHRALRAELALMTPGTRLRWSHGGGALVGGDGVLQLLTNSLPHTQSGYTVRSHAVLRAQRDAGLSPTAMTRVGYPVVVGGLAARGVDVVDGIAYHRALPATLAPTPDGRLAQQADALARLAADVRPSALQTTTHYPNAIVVREVAEALGLPWAYEVRGMLEQTWLASLGSDEARERAAASERYRLTREREAELASDADIVFTLAESMAGDLAERGVPRQRIRLVPNGIDAALLERPSVDAADARARLGLPREGFWVGATSSIVDYEGFDVLLDAVAIARGRGHDIRVLVVGDGTALPALRAQAERLGIADAVVLPRRVGRDAALAHRDALDLFVVPRRDRAVTRTVAPLKPVEAMAVGLPLVVSDLPPLVETLGGPLAADAAVPPDDARALAERIVALAGDEGARERMRVLGRERAATRTWAANGTVYAQGILSIRRSPHASCRRAVPR